MASKTKQYRIVELINGFYVERFDEWGERKGWPWNRYTKQCSKWRPLCMNGVLSYKMRLSNEFGPSSYEVVPEELFEHISDAKALIDYLQTPEEDKIKYPIYHEYNKYKSPRSEWENI